MAGGPLNRPAFPYSGRAIRFLKGRFTHLSSSQPIFDLTKEQQPVTLVNRSFIFLVMGAFTLMSAVFMAACVNVQPEPGNTSVQTPGTQAGSMSSIIIEGRTYPAY